MSRLKIVLLVIILSVAGNVAFYSILSLAKSTAEPEPLINIPTPACDPSSATNSPQIMKIMIGVNNTVTWKNWGTCTHTIVGDTEIFRSESLGQNQTWSYTFKKEGVYRYHSEPLPWLQGYIVVVGKEPSSAERILNLFDENPRFASINDIKPNSASSFHYPIPQNPYGAFSRWLLIRLPESLGGDKNDESAFRAYSMVDIRLHCLIQYSPKTLHMSEPCHGTSYDVLNGVAVRGPGVNYNFPNNALPKLELGIDDAGFLYVKPPRFTVDANGVIGYGRMPKITAVLYNNSSIPIVKPEMPEVADKLPIKNFVTNEFEEAQVSMFPEQAVDSVVLSDQSIFGELQEPEKIIVDSVNVVYPNSGKKIQIPYYSITGRIIAGGEDFQFERTIKAVDYKISTKLDVDVYPKDLFGNFDKLAIKGFLKGIDDEPVRHSTIMFKFGESYPGTDIETDANGCFYYNDWNKHFGKLQFDDIRNKGNLSAETGFEVIAYGNEDYNGTSVPKSLFLSVIPPPHRTELYSIALLRDKQPVHEIVIESNRTAEFELRVEGAVDGDQTLLLTEKNFPCDIDVEIIPEVLEMKDTSYANAMLRISAHTDRSSDYKIAILATNEKGHLLTSEWFDVSVVP